MSELFPVEHTLSPKAAWLSRHNLRTRREKFPRTYISAHAQDLPFTCHNPSMTRTFCGETEDAAIWEAARGLGIAHWGPEAWDKAMGGARIVDEGDC